MFERDTKSRSKSTSRQKPKPPFDKHISNKNYLFDDHHLNPPQNSNSQQQLRNQSHENILIYGDRIQKPSRIYSDQILPNSNTYTLHPGPSDDIATNKVVGKPPLLIPISKTNYQARSKSNMLSDGLQEVSGPLVNSAKRMIKSEHGTRNRHDTSYEKKDTRNLASDKRSTTPLSRPEEAALTLEERFQLLAYGGLQYVHNDARTPAPLNESFNSREKTIKAKLPALSKKLPPSLSHRGLTQFEQADPNEQNSKMRFVNETTQVSDNDLLTVTAIEPSSKPQSAGKNRIPKQMIATNEEKKHEKIFEKYKPQQFLDKGRENQKNVQNISKESPRQQQQQPEELKPITRIGGKRNSLDHAALKSPRNDESSQQNSKRSLTKQNSWKLPPTHNSRGGPKRVSSATTKNRPANQILEKLENESEAMKSNRDLAAEILMNNVDNGGFDGWGGEGAEDWDVDSPLKLRSSKL